jgi:hypothetical protein
MKIVLWFQGATVSLASLAVGMPHSAWAQAPQTVRNMPVVVPLAPTAAPATLDVTLGEHGQLQGQVVDAQGVGFAGADVLVWQNDCQIGSARADAQGRFIVSGLRGGVYRLLAAGGCGVFRVWTKDAAPPAARSAVLVVANQNIVRGRIGPTRWQQATPWVMAGVLGAAMIVPISLTNDNPSGS